jgi:dihydroxyacetone kinase-like predicted kinase
LVLGDEQIIKVHVHVPDPGVPISYGVKLGSLRDVVVEDMQAQSEVFLPGETKKATEPEHQEEVETGIVAVAAGDGLLKLFKELGARAIVEGGQTMNPSVEDLLNAIQRAKARNVIVLPNNGNIVMTAQQAAQISEIPAHVVTTKTLPQGIGALMAFNFEQDTHANVDSMAAASKRITTGEITISTRDVTINNVSVKNGQIIGLIDDKLSNAGEDVAQVLLDLLKIAGTDGREVISLYYGNNQSEAQANAVAEQVREAYPDQAVDVYYGGQPHYYFVVGIE